MSETFMILMINQLESLFVSPIPMDGNPKLLGTADGLIDFTETPPCFRQSLPEDMVSLRSTIKYGIEPDKNAMRTILEWLEQIFEHPVEKDTFLRTGAEILTGLYTPLIWLGKGNNGKSMMFELFKLILGPACSTRLRYKEPNLDDKIFLEKGNLIIVNEMPWVRAVVPPTCVNFTGVWCKDPPDNPVDQYATRRFKADPKFKDQLSKLAPAFLALLVGNYSSA